ncbi:MAG: long-chain fatty acid--CoA ligase [Treponemataceae bacterium]|nr:long-chain fatty acid--CoA ligase [Treponemataceae bacterium]
MEIKENTLPKILRRIATENPKIPAQYSKDKTGKFQEFLYEEVFQNVKKFAGGLLALGVKRGDHIGLISDNRKEWFQADMGLMSIGAIDVPRGCDATEHDLRYILSFAECKTVIAENSAQVKKILALKADIPLLERFICFEEIKEDVLSQLKEANIEFFTFAQIMEKGHEFNNANPDFVEKEIDKGEGSELACIIFTSGTTGEPKGVMLSHSNFIAQLDDAADRICVKPRDKAICVLPVWHAFQRACEYVVLCQGACLAYSKPIGSILLADMQALNPQVMPAVPRVFEAVYDGVMRTMRKTGGIVYSLFRFFTNIALIQSKLGRKMFRKEARFKKDSLLLNWIICFIPWLILTPLKALGGKLVFSKIRAKLGNRFIGGVSGGGALPPAIDEFFWAVGVNVVEGYGLTETSPVVSVRPFADPIMGTVGKVLRGLEVKIVDENGETLPPGKKGVVMVRGGTVMQGYYNKPELTAKAIDKDGWFDTGDIGMLTIDGEIVLRGRMKDTIVLRGGENVEPLPIEMKITESRYVATAVVVGQDERSLGALIIPAEEEIKVYARENYIPNTGTYAELLQRPEIKKLIDSEIATLVNGKTGFKPFERISGFALLEKPFEVGVELSAKQEIMRYKIADIYAKEIKSIYAE